MPEVDDDNGATRAPYVQCMLLNFIHNGNFNDDLGSIVYTTEIAQSQDCALVPVM